MDEVLTGSYTSLPIYSAFTLLALRDSGNYEVNISAAAPLKWGFNASCDFITKSCLTVGTTSPTIQLPNFCNSDSAIGCDFYYSARGYCNVANFSSPIPSYDDYFGNGYTGGAYFDADFCPMYVPYVNGHCNDATNQPTNDQNIFGENYGSGSQCFTSSMSSKDFLAPTIPSNAACYTFYCITDGSIYIKAGSSYGTCSSPGQVITFSNFLGSLTCPQNFALYCSTYNTSISDIPSGTSTGTGTGTGGGGNAGTMNVYNLNSIMYSILLCSALFNVVRNYF